MKALLNGLNLKIRFKMEKEVFRSKYAIANYDGQFELYTLIFQHETEKMTDKEWKELMLSLLEITETYKPKYIIDDNSERMYAYPPDMQAWTLEVFINNWNKNGLKKYVQILPTDIINQISAEQILELGNTEFSPKFKNKFVANFDEALKWIREPE